VKTGVKAGAWMCMKMTFDNQMSSIEARMESKIQLPLVEEIAKTARNDSGRSWMRKEQMEKCQVEGYNEKGKHMSSPGSKQSSQTDCDLSDVEPEAK
jgi:hypothetical protein